jgi:AraC-like DNA-binding protein
MTARILARIDADFAEPDFSTKVLAQRLRLSSRYIQALLQDRDLSVGDRIKDLRLRKAQAMLLGDRCCALKISDVALSCGFNEMSYFHRCFRKRFGVTPAKFRARAARE